MTPEQATFVSQICENPDDDTVRLVYADWLDENGDPDRAAFIRVQVQIAKAFKRPAALGHVLPTHQCRECAALWHADGRGRWNMVSDGGPCCADAPPLTSRVRKLSKAEAALFVTEKELLDRPATPGGELDNETAWLNPFLLQIMGESPPVHDGRPRNEGRVFLWGWSRGFLSEFTLDPVAWVANADKIVLAPDACGRCRGTGSHAVNPYELARRYGTHRAGKMIMASQCSVCSGTGVAYPVYPTTTPVTSVTLTDYPRYTFLEDGRARLDGRQKTHWVPRGEDYDHSRYGIAETLCELEWPRVEFTIERSNDEGG